MSDTIHPITFSRVSCQWKWKELVSHIEEKDLPDLLNNHEFLMFLLGNRKNQPKEFFHLSKKFILDQLSVEHIAQNEVSKTWFYSRLDYF